MCWRKEKRAAPQYEVGAPETGFCGSRNQVLTPRDNDLSPVHGPVVAARAVDYHLLRDETTCVAIELRCTDVRLKADTAEALPKHAPNQFERRPVVSGFSRTVSVS
jgi:hypothetical protein